VTVCHCPELAGQCKGHHEILNRQKFVLLSVYPLVAFMVLALRTMTMAAGHRAPVGMITVGTAHKNLTGLRCSAVAYPVQCCHVTGQHHVIVSGQKYIVVLTDNRSQFHDYTFQKFT
jgi:hypothetical protein